MKLQAKCRVKHKGRECQLAVLPNSDVCRYHSVNPHKLPNVYKGIQPRAMVTHYTEQLREEQQGCCALCGNKIKHKHDTQVDHLICKRLNGQDNIENCGLVHANCNRVKRDLAIHAVVLRKRLADIYKHQSHGYKGSVTLDEDDKDRLVAVYQSGKSLRRTADAIGVGGTLVLTVLKERGVKRRDVNPRKVSNKQIRKIIKMRAAGCNIERIVKKVGINKATTYSVLRANDVYDKDSKRQRDKDIVAAVSSGHTLQEAAEKNGVSSEYASRIYHSITTDRYIMH